MYDIPQWSDVASAKTMSKAELTEARRVEFKKSFLMRYV
jgi:hypothetical protein